MIGDAIADDMDDIAFLLQAATQRDHRRGHDLAPVNFETIRPEDAIGDAGLVFDRDEQHTLGRTRTLPDQKDARDLDVPTITDRGELSAAHDVHRVELLA
jgi:hypothetical protein